MANNATNNNSVRNLWEKQAMTVPRFKDAQQNRTLVHPTLPQPLSISSCALVTAEQPSPITQQQHCFIVAADTQYGMTNMNTDWEIEKEYSRKAIAAINALEHRPLFCVICGDLVDMIADLFVDTPKRTDPSETTIATTSSPRWTRDECDKIQDQQNYEFRQIWQNLHPDIALVCLCGNHDVGNRPTTATIQRFTNQYGDDYLAFWANGTYNIVLNSALFNDPTETKQLYQDQLTWLEQRLQYATQQKARQIFVFSHHPWFLYAEDEQSDDLKGFCQVAGMTIYDGYFHIPIQYRKVALDLFQKYHVSAAFSGHFHQNLIAKTSFGMDVIITGPLSLMLKSSGIPADFHEPQKQGYRRVNVEHDTNGGPTSFSHEFIVLD
jgi:hypothetical protein